MSGTQGHVMPIPPSDWSREVTWIFDDVFMLMSHTTTFSLSDWLRATFAALWLVTDWSSHVYYWYAFLYLTLESLFPAASLANLSLISLERLHATIYPFRHCLIREQVYFTVITFSWPLALLFAFMMAILVVLRAQFTLFFYIFASYCFITVLIITVSYVIIILNVKRSPQSNIFGSKLLTEKKLSITLFVMTVASFLIILPWAVWVAILSNIWCKLSPVIAYRFHLTFSALYLCNSIVNPIIYALRMQEFRKAARKLCCYRESKPVESIELPAV